MTREEKINTLKAIIQECEEYQWQRKETLFEIIKDLEQETVSKEVYDHEYFLRKEFEAKIDELYLLRKKFDELQRQLEEQTVKAESILKKIRAEIESITPKAHIHTGKLSIDTELMIPLDRVLQVIDKNKVESEEV